MNDFQTVRTESKPIRRDCEIQCLALVHHGEKNICGDGLLYVRKCLKGIQDDIPGQTIDTVWNRVSDMNQSIVEN
jgi:hypothetical protein